ncbi:MAG: hypothetical protein ACRDHE_02835 [Ktedonobacterales bacterium]
MGKYKQWLHHQEIGRRLRDQINTLEQERARVQKMAPSHPTNLPETDNPIISALLSYTSTGSKLSNIDPIQAAMPVMDVDPDQRQPVISSAATAAASAPFRSAAGASDSAVVASLLARADQMPSDPLDQMRELSRARDDAEAHSGAGASGSTSGALAPADSVDGWWQRQRGDDQDA